VTLTISDAATLIENAKAATDIFGFPPGSDAQRLDAVSNLYRDLVRVIHPDHWDEDDMDRANAVFLKLTVLKEEAENLIRYGKAEAPPQFEPTEIRFKSKGKETVYNVTDIIAQGDLADIFRADKTLLKVARSAADNDLLEREAKILRKLRPEGKNDKFYRYLPRLLGSFGLKSPGERGKQVNVLPYYKGHYSLTEVMQVYPDGLSFRDVVWMFKRCLAGLGFVHRQGVVHGALIPPHILVHPVMHGAKLIDWCYAAERKERVKAMSIPFESFYAPEILNKETAHPATDIFMLAKCAMAVMGTTDIPFQVRGFFESCTLPSITRRPNDAWKLHEEFDELLYKLVGKPKYRLLVMPARKGA
jgi:serine/threonine protein kinase